MVYDCLMIVFVRSGSAIVFSEFGHQTVGVGDAVLIGPNVLFSAEPEELVTVTAVYVDTDFALDQFFWPHSTVLHDRLDAQGFAEKVYSEPAQVLRLDRDRAGLVAPWLDEMVALSVEGCFPQRFNRLQALWFAVMDVLAPYIRISQVRLTPLQRARSRPVLPRTRRFAPLRREAMLAREALLENVAHPAVGGRAIKLGHGLPSRLNPLDEGYRPSGMSDEQWTATVVSRRRDLIGALTETVLARPMSPLEHTAIDTALAATMQANSVPILPMIVDHLLDPEGDEDGRLQEDGRMVGHALRRLRGGWSAPPCAAWSPVTSPGCSMAPRRRCSIRRCR